MKLEEINGKKADKQGVFYLNSKVDLINKSKIDIKEI